MSHHAEDPDLRTRGQHIAEQLRLRPDADAPGQAGRGAIDAGSTGVECRGGAAAGVPCCVRHRGRRSIGSMAATGALAQAFFFSALNAFS
jgi:hypothetical protein